MRWGWGGVGWGKNVNVHVTLPMHVLLPLTRGGVDGLGWGGVGNNVHAAPLMYIVCGSISNLGCLHNCKPLRGRAAITF